MGMHFDEVKDISFETQYFWDESADALNKRINKFLSSNYLDDPNKTYEENWETPRGRGKIVPVNISYSTRVEPELVGFPHPMIFNHTYYEAILLYKFIEEDQ